MKSIVEEALVPQKGSLPARGVWIEILKQKNRYGVCFVTPRKGSVD